jgi:hypothetical protein
VRLARPRRPKIVCSSSYADIRSRANTILRLDFDHMMRWELEKRLVWEELIQNVTHMYRKSMWVNSLYSYPYLNKQKPLVLPIIAYILSSTKLEIRSK